MKKQLKVEITTKVYLGQSQPPQQIDQLFSGELEHKEDDLYVSYIENEGRAEEVKTVISIEPERIVLDRQGAISYRQIYEPGKINDAMLKTAEGYTPMEVNTIAVKRKIFDDRGILFLSYILKLNKEKIGHYRVKIDWTVKE